MTGVPSASAASGFTVHASNVEGAKDGLYFYGTNGRQLKQWGNGSSFQCVVPPVKPRRPPGRLGQHRRCVRRLLLPGHQRPVERQPAQEPGRGRGGATPALVPRSAQHLEPDDLDVGRRRVRGVPVERIGAVGSRGRAFPFAHRGRRARLPFSRERLQGRRPVFVLGDMTHQHPFPRRMSHETPERDPSQLPPRPRRGSPPAGRPRTVSHRGLPHHDLPGRGPAPRRSGTPRVGEPEAPRLRALPGRVLRHDRRRASRRGPKATTPSWRTGRPGSWSWTSSTRANPTSRGATTPRARPAT